jgi:hypothetical protein
MSSSVPAAGVSAGVQYPGLEMDYHHNETTQTLSGTAEKDNQPLAPIRHVTPVFTKKPMYLPVNEDNNNNNNNDNNSDNPTTASAAAVDYGYGDAAPDVAASYGYGDAAPDVAASYGYGDGAPDVAKSATAADSYGYGDGAPDSFRNNNDDYGYSSDIYSNPKPRSRATKYEYDGTRVPRRSSLKSSGYSYNYNEHNQPPNGDLQQQQPSRQRAMRRNSAIEVRVRGERHPVQRRRSIDFAETVHVKEVEPVKNLTEDVRQLWLQDDDFAEMKVRRRNLVKKYKEQQKHGGSGFPTVPNLNGGSHDVYHTHEGNYDDSFRGLEKYVDKSARRTKNVAWDTVLLEQDEQECSGYYDENRIAELYKFSTMESPEKALARAQQDRAAVEDYLTSPRTAKLMAKTKFKAFRRVSC